MSDALPLLRKVEEVAVVELIQDEAAVLQPTAGSMTLFLARSAWHRRIWQSFSFSRARGIIRRLWQYGANFIVAGAFGHSQLRERVFGGFTDDLLRRSPLCTFFSH